MATASTHTTGASISKSTNKRKPRKPKGDVIKKDSSGTSTRQLIHFFKINHINVVTVQTY